MDQPDALLPTNHPELAQADWAARLNKSSASATQNASTACSPKRPGPTSGLEAFGSALLRVFGLNGQK